MLFCSKCGMKQPEEGGAAPAGRPAPGPGPAGAPVPPATPPSNPAGPYPPAPPVRMGDTGRGAGWIMFLRVLLWIVFAAICLTGLYLAMPIFNYGGSDGAIAALGIIVGSVLLAFTVVAAGMVSLDAAQNIRRCAINSANILDLLNQRRG